MNRPWKAFGKLAFWLSWPFLLVSLHFSHRTRVLVVAEGKLLLVKGWLGTGEWSLPGGGLHRGESQVAGAIREVKEETGLSLKSRQLKLLYKGRAKRHGLSFNYICFVAQLPKIPPTNKQFLEIVDIDWISLSRLQPGMLTEDTQQAVTTWRSTQPLLK